MSGKVFFVLLSFLLIISFKQYTPGTPSFKMILSAYTRADRLFNSTNSSSATDSTCMEGFRDVISALSILPKEHARDSLIYQAYNKLGILYEVYKDFSGATAAYLHALNFSLNSEEKFRMNIFAGAGYYNLNNFDSASFYLSRAEESPDNLGSAEDRARLYNTLGVLYYDNGNYLQSKNYFTQALRLIESKNPTDKLSAYSIQLNTATCFYKLGLYEQALLIYRKVLGYHLLPDPLYMNMGRAYAGLHQYQAALSYFRKVKIAAVPGVLNEMARTALETGNADSASAWLIQYQKEKKLLRTNALDDGVNEFYSGDLDIFRANPESGLQHLQEALVLFSGSFSSKDIRTNPGNFTGSFAYYRLFDVLVKKAGAWEMVYKKTSRPEDLKSAFDTYQSTISLLSYIERSYEMDDAKILLKQKSGGVYTNALSVCLQLNSLYPKTGFLEEAFLITEKNKASVMSSQIRERNFLLGSGPENNFASEERNIKFNIARLDSKEDGRMSTQDLQKINDEKAVYETQLVNLRRKMEGNSHFYQLKYTDDFPSIRQLQKSMGSDQALISFYNDSEKIEVFVLTKSSLDHVELDSGESIRHNIQSWIEILQSAGSGRHWNSNGLRANLYTQLMRPIISLAGDKDKWIIVPDGIFFLLPVESLPGDGKGGMIIENHEVSYEFSARFIVDEEKIFTKTGTNKPILSFAPFSKRGADLQSEGMGSLEKLPFSQDEIAGLNGSRFDDQYATKEVFIKNLNRFPIIHLATHAITDLNNPSASYIAFFPASGIRSEDFLFLDEIYSLRMDSCQMIVISACETGRGELVHNEGVISFARAFLYSGCPSTINTLWKADDHSTAEIIRLFYQYLEEGNTKSRALQKAKLEYIRNNPIYRDPAYWSHIILTGSPAALYKKKQPWIWAVIAISCGTILFLTIRKRKEKKVDAFHSLLDV
jgi:CHAT domain-containing protein/tetratricopeptide (TPR) repeat protein